MLEAATGGVQMEPAKLTRRTLMVWSIGVWSAAGAHAQDQAKLKRNLQFERTVNFIIDDDELLPATLTLPPGQYRLAFLNSLVNERLDLAIEDDKGKSLISTEVQAKKTQGDVIYNFTPGKHTIYVRQRPRWKSILVISENVPKEAR